MEEVKEKKGAGFKAFGIMMMVLASIDLMFCWKAGFPVDVFYPTILVVGIASFAFGALRGNKS